ncbi:MAG TPA: hypothetical protein VHC22_07210 [Pirellulales bacterium]|nr:hypothetical protein [Pirellulales bacterium]
MPRLRCFLAVVVLVGVAKEVVGQESFASHAPLRPLPEVAKRPLEKGPIYFVDPVRGDDGAAGDEAAPWRSINFALGRLTAADTLCLRGGIYREEIYCAVAGRPDAPITVRAYPGERAIIDAGLAEFFDDPAHAWTPVEGGAPGEYRSVRVYKNIRDVVGLFGDSHIGLQTYWHIADLRATNELWIDDPDKKQMVLPMYCGPGLWYDRDSGHIHVRLAHTQLKAPPVGNYRGETDPRKLPLVIAPFKALPLKIDMAKHVRFQDLVLRGGGHDCIVLQMGIDVEIDNVTVFAGTYGLRSRSTGPFRMIDSAIHGMIPPWAWRDENGLYTYTPRFYDPFVPGADITNQRNIARLNTHALVVTEGSYEFEVFYYPHNHDWEIAHCEFTDGHDGVYLSGRAIRFHHNVVERIQDDGIYLSSPVNYFSDDIHIYQNLLRDVLSAFACNNRGGPTGDIYIYRNIADQRQGVPFNRPTPMKPDGNFIRGHGFLAHGNELLGIESLHFYHNTFITESLSGSYAARTWTATHPRTRRTVLNNLFVYLNRYPDSAYPQEHDIRMDGNLHWCPAGDAVPPDRFLESVRLSKGSQAIAAKHPGGWEAHALVADPRFVAFDGSVTARNDYRLQPGSPAIGTGVVLPAELNDPLRPEAGVAPDIGAIPSLAEAWAFGPRGGRTFPLRGTDVPRAAGP